MLFLTLPQNCFALRNQYPPAGGPSGHERFRGPNINADSSDKKGKRGKWGERGEGGTPRGEFRPSSRFPLSPFPPFRRLMGGRPVVGHMPLEHGTLVRIQASQPVTCRVLGTQKLKPGTDT